MENDIRQKTEIAELRRGAEETLSTNMSKPQPPRTEEGLQRLVHELEVYKIELEIQNSELRQARDEVESTLEKYTELYDFALVGYLILDRKGIIRSANLPCAAMLGIERSGLAGRSFGLFVDTEYRPDFAGFLEKLFASQRRGSCEVRLTTGGSPALYVRIEAVVCEELQECRIVVIDITELKLVEEERETTIEFLRIANESRSTSDLIRTATAFFQQRSGCDAVGIRLHEGDDYPYYEFSGFSQDFILAENSLCSRDSAGDIIRDSAGNPVIDCMCGNVICSRFDPSLPFFTSYGSFWTNSTSELLASATELERQSRTRNRCNGEGYESVTLIPLRLGENRLGLLQLNDRQKGRFSAASIALWERLADYLSVALAKFRADEALYESEERHRVLADTMLQGVVHLDANGKIMFMNPAAERILGKCSEKILGNCSVGIEQDTIRDNGEIFPVMEHPTMEALRTGLPVSGVIMGVFNPERNEYRWIRIDAVPVFRAGEKKTSEVYSIFEDITERRRAEENIRRNAADLLALNEELSMFNKVAVGRELRMIELKKEINTLYAQSGLPPRYELDSEMEQ